LTTHKQTSIPVLKHKQFKGFIRPEFFNHIELHTMETLIAGWAHTHIKAGF